jgi:acyl-CoA synthetase (AMP-forming)/AMP-acid ligase II
MTSGWIRRERLEKPEGLALFGELSRVLDRGEAASLAWAIVEKAAIACDDSRARREAHARIGEGRPMCRLDARFVGRTEILVRERGASQVSSLQLEELISAHPGVAAVAVIGVPYQRWGERAAGSIGITRVTAI